MRYGPTVYKGEKMLDFQKLKYHLDEISVKEPGSNDYTD
jgi:hypothetical protein